MQRYLNNLELWLKKWRLKTSGSKCSYNIYQKNQICKKELNLKLFGESIIRDKNPRYLGVILDSNMNLSTYVEYIRSKCLKKMNILKILNNKKWKISVQTKLIIYYSLVRSNIDYAGILFHHISEFCKKRLQGVQYACLRLILNKPFAYSSSIMHQDLKLITLPERFEKLHENYLDQALVKNNMIINLHEEYLKHDKKDSNTKFLFD